MFHYWIVPNSRGFSVVIVEQVKGYSGPAILDTAGPLYNLHYLNRLGSPRSPNQRKFSEALMHSKTPLPRGWKRRVRSSVLALSDNSQPFIRRRLQTSAYAILFAATTIRARPTWTDRVRSSG